MLTYARYAPLSASASRTKIAAHYGFLAFCRRWFLGSKILHNSFCARLVWQCSEINKTKTPYISPLLEKSGTKTFRPQLCFGEFDAEIGCLVEVRLFVTMIHNEIRSPFESELPTEVLSLLLYPDGRYKPLELLTPIITNAEDGADDIGKHRYKY